MRKRRSPAEKSVVRYPWEDWYSRGGVRLRRGRDFAPAPHVMAQIVRNACRLVGRSASINVEGDVLDIVFR